MDLSQVVARAHISQQEAAQLKVGDAATISVPGQGADVHGQGHAGEPCAGPEQHDGGSLGAGCQSGRAARPGTSVRVTIVAETVPHAIVVPAAALLTDPDGVTSVIVLDSDNKPHKQKVKVGIRNGDDVQITDGLKGGERVVTVGAFELDSEDRRRAGENQDSSASAEDARRRGRRTNDDRSGRLQLTRASSRRIFVERSHRG